MENRPLVLLAIPGGEGERDFLGNLSTESGWELHLARTFQEAVTVMQTQRAGVVLSETRFADGHCWRDLLKEIQRHEFPPMLIVADRLADERLWSEVLSLGGYDLLLKPFEPEEVLHVVKSAWRSWQLARRKSRRVAA